MVFIERIEKLIGEQGVTQAALERAAMMPKNKISKIKSGDQRPAIEEVVRLARILGVSPAYLIDEAARPGGDAGLRPEDRAVLTVMRSLGITPDDAIRALTDFAFASKAGIEMGTKMETKTAAPARGRAAKGARDRAS